MVSTHPQYAYALCNVRCGRKIRRITANVDPICVLIPSDPVNPHRPWKLQVIVVDSPEVLGYTEVHDQILTQIGVRANEETHGTTGLTIGSCGTGLALISTVVSAAIPAAVIRHANCPFDIHAMYCV